MPAEGTSSADDPRFATYRRDPDRALRNVIVEDHLTLARAFARRYANRGVATEDLEQVAQLALIKAVERFDPDVGVRFSTYAGRTIEGELKHYFRDRAWSVRAPRRSQDLGIAIRHVVEELTQELARPPTVAEVAERIGGTIDEVVAAMEASQAFRADSLDAPVRGEDARSAADMLGDLDGRLGAFEDREAVVALLGRLDDRARRIVELRFFEELSQREIGESLGISQMHVSRLLRKALLDLRAGVAD